MRSSLPARFRPAPLPLVLSALCGSAPALAQDLPTYQGRIYSGGGHAGIMSGPTDLGEAAPTSGRGGIGGGGGRWRWIREHSRRVPE